MTKKLPPLIIYPSRVKTLVLVAISAGLVILPLAALLLFWSRLEDIKTVSPRLYASIWMGIVLLLLFGSLGLVFNLRQLILPRPIVTVSGRGIEPLWFGLIPWDEIDRLAKVKCQGQWMLGIYPRDTDEFLARQAGLRRSLIERAMEQGFPPVYVTQLALPMAVDEVLAEIRRYTDVPISKAAS